MKRTLSHILTSEDRVVRDADGDFSHHEYHLKDHLGNTRVVFTEDDGVIKNNDYYPFGMLIDFANEEPEIGSNDNKFLYNGKVFIRETDPRLGWYDYGARMYDPQLGRWHSVDPLAELTTGISPYVYCYNNPISNIDPDGMLAGLFPGCEPPPEPDYFQPEDYKNPKSTLPEPWIDRYMRMKNMFPHQIGANSDNNGSTSYPWGPGDPDNEFGNFYVTEEVVVKASDDDDAANSGGSGKDFSLARMYGHFQFGGGKPLTIDASTIDFSGTTQRALGLNNLEVDQTMDPVNLFNMGATNPAALAFGRVPITRISETEFTIGNNGFDFTPFYDQSASTGRNVGNAIGFGVNYNFWLGPGSVLIPVIFGGPYDVIFNGTVTIPK